MTVNGSAAVLGEVPKSARYRGFLSRAAGVTLNSLVKKLVGAEWRGVVVPVTGLDFEVSSLYELRGFTVEVGPAGQAEAFSLGDFVSLMGARVGVVGGQLPRLQVGLRKFRFDVVERRCSVLGQIIDGVERAEVELDVGGTDEGGVAVSLGYFSEREASLKVKDLIEGALPEGFGGLLDSGLVGSEFALLRKVMDSGVSAVDLSLDTGQEDLGFLARGSFLGMQGEAGFSISKIFDTRMVSFHVLGDEQQNLAPISRVLKKTLGLEIPPELRSFVPKMEFALAELRFDQLEQRFTLRGLVAQRGVSKGKKGYELQGSLQVGWSGGLSIDLELDASKAPVKLSALEGDLPFSLSPVKKMLPKAVVERLAASEFHSFQIALDTAARSVEVEGVSKVFGELLTFGSFRFSKEHGLKLEARIYNDPMPLRELPALMGIADSGFVELIPDLGIGLSRLLLDQQQAQFSISGKVGIGETRAETSFGLRKPARGAGQVIDLGFAGDAEHPPSMIALLGAVIPGVEESEIRLPGDPDISLDALELSIDTRRKSISGEGRGRLLLAGVPISLSAKSAGGADPWRLEAETRPEAPIHLMAVAQEILGLKKVALPVDVADVTLEEVGLSLVPQTGVFRFAGKGGAALPVDVAGAACSTTLGLLIERQSANKPLTGRLTGTLSYAELELALDCELSEQAKSLTASAKDLNLRKIVEQLLGIDLPDGLPDVVIELLSFDLDSRRNVHLEGRAKLAGEALTLGETTLPLGSLAFDYRQKGKTTTCRIAVEGKRAVITSEIEIESFSLAFEYDDGDWKLAGDVASRILDQAFALAAAYGIADGTKRFELSYEKKTKAPLVEIPHAATLDMAGLKLSVASGKAKGTSWELAAEAALHIADGLIDFDGKLSLYDREDGSAGVVFQPTEAGVDIPLPAGGELSLEFGGVSLVKEARTGWCFEATTGLGCSALRDALPENVRKVLPETVTTTFRADRRAVTLSAKRLLNPIDFDLPDIDVGTGETVALGAVRLDATDLSISIGKEVSGSASFALGLPAALNNLFGVEQDGVTPRAKLFKTFDPADADNSVVKMRLVFGTQGVEIMLETSPIEAVVLERKGDKVWWNCDFGEFGGIRLQVPTLAYDVQKGAFAASGGFEVTKPLAIPLTPLKAALANLDAQAVADVLPSKLPLEEITILDEKDNFRAEELCGLMSRVIPGQKLPKEIEDAVGTMGKYFDRLPDAFREYLDIRLPQSFNFSIAVTPDGSVRFDVRVKKGDPPVKTLYVTQSGPLFYLEGIKLYGLSFGLALNGAVALVQADVVVDEFDLLALAMSLLVPKGVDLPIPDPRHFQRRIIVHDLDLAIILAFRVPIPVPLFYGQLGIEYLGPEGVTFETHVMFPRPEVSLPGLAKVLASFVGFVSQRDALMDPDALSGEQQLRLGAGKNYLRLPEYLGGALLGYDGEEVYLDSYSIVAKLMNAIKRGSVNDLVQVVPLDYRVGNESVQFGPVEIGIQWLLSTPDEFRQGAYRQLVSTPEEAERYLEVLPATVDTTAKAAAPEQGVIVFLGGHGSFAEWASFDAAFGLAAAGSTGFQTGFRVEGQIAHLIDMELAGLVSIDPPDEPFALAGHSHLVILDHRIFVGDVRIKGMEFEIRGDLSLFPKGSLVQVNGKLEGSLGKKKLHLYGDVTTKLAGVKLVGAKALISDAGVWVQGELFGTDTELAAIKRDGRLALLGEVTLDLWGWTAHTAVEIDRVDGLDLSAEVSPVDLPGLRITGAAGETRPSASFRLDDGRIKSLEISACVELLGFETDTKITASETGFSFAAAGRIYSRFQCRLEAAGSVEGGGARVRARIEGDFLDTLVDGASGVLREAAGDFDKVSAGAVKAVKDLQREVARLDGVVSQQRDVVRSERQRATAGLRSLEDDVEETQDKVNSRLKTIRSLEADVRELKKGRWKKFLGIKYWKYKHKGAVLKIAAKKLKITYHWGRYGVETGLLSLARKALKDAQRVAAKTPIDLDPRVSFPLAARKAAGFSLERAEETLEALRAAAGMAAEITRAIQSGVGQLLEVHSAQFEGALGDVSFEAAVAMQVEFTFLGKRRTETIAVRFSDVAEDAQALGRLLLTR